MSDIIKLLSDSVANQIAAGEVVQRPASVVKELVENSLDAGATSIDIIIKDAGRTLIQVVDNGVGMSPTDARMSFERHATSKISKAEDLFAITTMGFRGEALASIAAVAEVELQTKREEDTVGTCINIAGSKVISQEPFSKTTGTNFMVKNLFFNIPARRKFLKSDSVESKHIMNEVYRIVLTNPSVAFNVVFDGNTRLQLFPENPRQRIVNVFGKRFNSSLIPISVETSIVSISGFVMKPEDARKNSPEQYFFVNNRYMYHPYFRKAVINAYEKILPEGEQPQFFIYLGVDPAMIDINIHPTKTEIKFDDEQSIFLILNSAVKEALGKFNVVPSMDFEEDITRDIHFTKNTPVRPPVISVNPDYNPFNNTNSYKREVPPPNWEIFYDQELTKDDADETFVQPRENHIDLEDTQQSLMDLPANDEPHADRLYMQLKNKYILTPSMSGMIVINQRRAHQRVMYEYFLEVQKTRRCVTQKLLFPTELELDAEERGIMIEMISELNSIGFEIAILGNNKFEISGVPAEVANLDAQSLIKDIFQSITDEASASMLINQKIALVLANSVAMSSRTILQQEEMENLFFRLMACSNHNYTADGKKIMDVITIDDIEQKF